MSTTETKHAFKIGPRIFMGFVLAFLLVAGAGGWAATAQLSGAVIAQGSVAVDQKVKAIQHRDGGIISEINVREGDLVRAGQILLRLEDAQTKAELSIVQSQLLELAARKARLLAERDGLKAIEFQHELQMSGHEAASIMNGEKRIFDGNRRHWQSQKNQLTLGIEQIGEEIRGLEAQRTAKSAEIALVEEEYAKIKSLADRKLIERNRIYTSDRDRTRLQGERGEIDAAIARAKTRASEIQLQIIAIDENARTEAQRELTAAETKISELKDRHMAIADRLSRTDIRAPITGTINELNIHTIGGVITPAEILVTIVPHDARLNIEFKLNPANIDQVDVGRPARLRFPAFNQRITPELKGEVTHVSPATAIDQASGEVYYAGKISVPPEQIAMLGERALVPGMPVEVYIMTQERTALSYLVKPITDQFNKAFRER